MELPEAKGTHVLILHLPQMQRLEIGWLARVDDYLTRAAAAASLGVQGEAQDLPRLRRMSRWDTESVRREAVWAVGRFRRSADIPFLQARTEDESRAVRTVAAMALTRIMHRDALERWLERHSPGMDFEVLVECDFALYAPRWLAERNPRIGEEHLSMDIGVFWPEFVAK